MSATKKRKLDGGVEETQFNEEDKPYIENSTTSSSTTSQSKFTLESSFDDLVGDLLKEELQLVLTRVVRDDPTLDVQVKKQILKVMNSRNRNSPPNPTALKQLELFAATFRQSQLLLNAVNTQRLTQAGGDQNTLDPTQLLHGGMGVGGNFSQTDLPFLGGNADQSTSGLLADVSLSGGFGGLNITAIRRKIRDAFVSTNLSSFAAQKRGRFGAPLGEKNTYRIASSVIRTEKEKAKEMILTKGEIREGLNIMEAITSEYVMRGTELGVQNCEGYDEMLNEIAKEWVEIFLFENLDIEQQEREEWAKKLFDWDTSANEEEGTFSTARYAAKLAWNNIHLRNVLKGESIGKFSEPVELSIARLNQLERDSRNEEGMNLAKAVDLDFYLARFLLKLERLTEAQQVAEKLEDASQLFSIAQLARASDVHVAFNLSTKAVAKAIQWTNEVADRARWLCDLAISNKLTDLLVEKTGEIIRHKTVQFYIAKILKDKEQYSASLSLCKICLKPYSQSESLKQVEPSILSTSSSPIQPQFDEGSIVPQELPRYLWELSHEMVLLESLNEKGMYDVLDYIIDQVDNINTLIQLFNPIMNKKEYDQVVVLGTKIFQKIESQSNAEFELQKELLRQVVENPELMAQFAHGVNIPVLQEQQQQQQATSTSSSATTTIPNPTNQFEQLSFITNNELFKKFAQTGTANSGTAIYPLVNLNLTYSGRWDNFRSTVAQQIINAGLASREPGLTTAPITTALLTIRPVKPMSNEKMADIINECLTHVNHIDHLTNFIRIVQSRSEYDLTITIADRLQSRITQIRQDTKKRQAIREEYQVLVQERNELQNARKNLKPDQERKLKDLEYQIKYFNLEPNYLDYDNARYDQYHYQTALSAIIVSLEAKNNQLDEQKKFSADKATEIIDRHLKFIFSPSHYIQLLTQIQSYQEYELSIKIGLKAIDIIQQFIEAKKVREEIEVPLQIIRDEQEQLLEKRQTLPAIRLQEMKKLEQQLEALPDTEHFDPDDVDQYDALLFNISIQIIRQSFNSKVYYEQALAQQFRMAGLLNQPQVQLKEPLSDDRIRQVVIQFSELIADPTNLIQIAKECANFKNYELMLEIGDRCQKCIAKLSKEREERAPTRLKYEKLRDEKKEAVEQKKVLKPDQLQQLAAWEIEQELNKRILPKYAKKTLDQYDNDQLTILKTMLVSILNYKSELSSNLKYIIQNEFASLSTESNKMTDEDQVDPKIEIKANIEKCNKNINSIVDQSLGFIENPNHLYTLATTLNEYNEYDIALTIGKVIQTKIPAIIKEKKERDAIRNELEELLDEERDIQEARKQVKNRRKKLDVDKAQKLEELQLQVNMFKMTPNYKDSSPEQLDQLNLNNSILLIQAMLKAKAADEAEMELDSTISEQDKQDKNAKHDIKINEVIELCLQYVKNPKHILSILDKIKGNDIELIFKIGKQAVEQATICETKKKERDIPEQLISIIKQEEVDLELLRKQLPEDVQKQLEEAQEKLEKMDVEYYVIANDYNDYDKWKYSAITKMLNAVLATKTDLENRIAYDQSLTPEQIEKETNVFNQNLKQVVDLVCDDNFGIHNPSNLASISSTLHEKNEFKQAITVGEKTLQILDELKKAEEERKLPEQQYIILVQEKQKQLQLRNQLPLDQQKQLRELSLKHNLLSLEPAYTKLNQDKYDSISFQVSRTMINAALDVKKNIDDKMDSDSQMVEAEYEKEATDASQFLESIVDKCIDKISSVENVIRILQDMAAKYEYGLVLRIGAHIQKNVLYLKEQVAKIKLLEEEQTQLQQQLRLQKNTDIENRLAAIQVELSNLPLKYKGFYTLDNFTLTTSELMMKAAKVEEDNAILLEQAIITFKITMTPSAFVEVKVLSGEDEWEKRRIQLLDYIVDHINDDKDVTDENIILSPSYSDKKKKKKVEVSSESEEDDYSDEDSEGDYRSKKRKRTAKPPKKAAKKVKSYGSDTSSSLSVHRRATMQEKLQLLLDEGMWRSVVAIFPPVERGGTIDLLERVYIEVQKDSPDKIDESLMKLVEQYVTREYQQYEFESSKSLLDLVEQRNRKFVEDLYDKLSETLLMTIVQKQYQSFVEFLKVVKERLTKYSSDDDDEESDEEDTKKKRRTPKKKAKQLPPWEKFFENLMKKHKGKKKLMQLIQLEPALNAQQ